MLIVPDSSSPAGNVARMMPEAPRAAASSPPQPVTLSTLAGEFVTRGAGRIVQDGSGWTATLSGLDQPGLVASLYFSARLRKVVLRLADGRQARARITGTSFSASAMRTCELAGVEPLVQAAPHGVPLTVAPA